MRHLWEIFLCVTSTERSENCLFCFSALVLLVKGPSVQLTQPGPSLCPLFTGTVIGPAEARTKGGSVPIVQPRMLKPLSGRRPSPELGVAREAAEGI